ncbi:MAG: hypothetical protein JWR81_1407 [Pseudonocardia sp.]|jgi:hypothetical protein|nr:hypothetical protein [Pseudonocardia sp.]MDT7612727.1 hypothetical protein [Pseudonocardiales bacterium]
MPTCRRGPGDLRRPGGRARGVGGPARRDLEALSAAVVPVHPQPGRGGWSLPGGARTDLTALTAPEAQALFGESAEAPRSYCDGHAEQTAFVLARVPPDEDERVAPEWAGLMRRRPARAAALVERGGRGGPAVRLDLATELAAADGEPVVVLDVLTTAIVTGHRKRRIPRRRRVRLGRCRGPPPFASREGPRVTFGMRPPCRTLLRMSVRLNRQGDQVEPRSHPRR